MSPVAVFFFDLPEISSIDPNDLNKLNFSLNQFTDLIPSAFCNLSNSLPPATATVDPDFVVDEVEGVERDSSRFERVS